MSLRRDFEELCRGAGQGGPDPESALILLAGAPHCEFLIGSHPERGGTRRTFARLEGCEGDHDEVKMVWDLVPPVVQLTNRVVHVGFAVTPDPASNLGLGWGATLLPLALDWFVGRDFGVPRSRILRAFAGPTSPWRLLDSIVGTPGWTLCLSWPDPRQEASGRTRIEVAQPEYAREGLGVEVVIHPPLALEVRSRIEAIRLTGVEHETARDPDAAWDAALVDAILASLVGREPELVSNGHSPP